MFRHGSNKNMKTLISIKEIKILTSIIYTCLEE